MTLCSRVGTRLIIRSASTTSERVTHLHISVPAITRGMLTRTYELKNQKIALFKKYFILQGKFHFSLTNEQRGVLNCVSLGHNLLVSGQARTGKSTQSCFPE